MMTCLTDGPIRKKRHFHFLNGAITWAWKGMAEVYSRFRHGWGCKGPMIGIGHPEIVGKKNHKSLVLKDLYRIHRCERCKEIYSYHEDRL